MKRGKLIIGGLLLSVVLALILLVCSLLIIKEDVREMCTKAKQTYNQDCAFSLMAYATSDEHSYRERNRAIWALGQIADQEALGFLLALSSQLPDREQYNLEQELSKYEVDKAIKWCRQGNAVSWMYKQRDSW